MAYYKIIRTTACTLFFLLPLTISAQVLPAYVQFEQYANQARDFADNYPREKAYLHFDNTSYYAGDTIWFKAYVTADEMPVPSDISRPLYVELVDQAGHVTDKQIIRLEHGEGCGQIPLSANILSGYYEVRAYTRWMLGFSEHQYFSRTFPIYKLMQKDQDERSITRYTLNKSMKLRPESVEKQLQVRFFPEGGQLVEGIESWVAFKAESLEEGSVELSGILCDADGQELTRIETMHDGMGRFAYTPSAKPATAKVRWRGKEYKFKLPEALPSGYVLSVNSSMGAVTVKVQSGNNTPQDTVAVFISRQGRPCFWQLVPSSPGESVQFSVLTRDLPSGVLQFSLLNRAGHILCERFSFVYPRSPLQITVSGLSKIYHPYDPIRCELQVKDSSGNPVAGGRLSVSIRDALHSDYSEYDNNMYTDLLFTSDLKGYIHQPGYYFTELSTEKLAELDVLMMVHGWRKYDMEQLIGVKPFEPLQLPEQELVLDGKVRSVVLKKPMKNMELSIMVKERFGGMMTGETVTDEEGRFSIPLESISGVKEALIQTRKQDRQRNRDATIMLDRNFSPVIRALDYNETHPEWKDMQQWDNTVKRFDSLYVDSMIRAGDLILDEVVVTARRKKRFTETRTSEQSIDAYYDVQRTVDQLRDEGKFVSTIPDFLDMMNSSFSWDRRDDTYTYRQKPLVFVMNGKVLSTIERQMILTEIDGIASIIICQGDGALGYDIVQNSENASLVEAANLESYTDSDTGSSIYQTDVQTTTSSGGGVSGKDYGLEESILSDITKYVFVYIIPLPYHDLMNTSQKAALGTRRTVLQGYTPVLEHYSPAYPVKELYMDVPDNRRTLYWNPSVQTDENGRAVVECYNNRYSTPLFIHAEILADGGRIGSVLFCTLQP